MKIPQILAQSEIGVADQPYASGDKAAAPYLELRRTADYAGQVAAQLATVGQKKDALGSKVELNALDAQMEYTAKTAVDNLKATETDPDEFKRAAAKAITEAYETALASAKYPETKAGLAQKLGHLHTTLGVAVNAHSNELFRDRGAAQRETNLAQLRVLASTAPDQPPLTEPEGGPYTAVKGALDYFNEGVKVIKDSTPFFPNGVKGAADRELLWRYQILMDRAYAKLRENPNADLSKFGAVLDSKSYESLLTHQGTLQRQQTAEYDRQQTRLEKDQEEARKYKLAQLSQLIIKQEAPENIIDQSLQIGLIKTREEYEHFATLQKNAGKADKESDPIVLKELTDKVYHPYSTSPKLIPEIQRAMTAQLQGGKGISNADGTRLLSHVSSAIETKDKDDYTRAKEEGFRRLGIITPMSPTSKKEAKLIAEYERQFNALARPVNPNGLPARDVLYQLEPIFRRMQDAEAKLTYQEQAEMVRGLLNTEIPDAMDPKFLIWYGEQSRATEALAGDPATRHLYTIRKQQLQELRTMRDAIRAKWIRDQENAGSQRGSSSRGTGGYTPPESEKK